MKNCNLVSVLTLSGVMLLTGALLPSPARAQTKSVVVEEIIARVNNDVITMSDYQKADEQLREEVAHDCQGCPQDKLLAAFKDQQKDLLRGLIDQSLMVQRAKDMGISVESDVIKRQDDDSQRPADAGSRAPRSGFAHQHSQRRSEAILRRASAGIHPARAGGAL